MNNFLFLLEAAPEGRILGFDLEFLMELGIQWLNTLILTLFLAKFLYKPVKRFMDNRAERISTQLATAGDAERTALTMKDDYEGKLRDVEQERVHLIDAARGQAQEKSEQIIAEARRDADRIRDRARKDIEMEQERAKDDMKKELIDISALLAGRFAAVSLDRQAQDSLIVETISDLGDVKWL
ncbi:MAG: F0F1 ATP synthase subunit B [Clostridiales bacterium]|nr:F0F1 ATP synthase subunit B [Clostridiales bacterium]